MNTVCDAAAAAAAVGAVVKIEPSNAVLTGAVFVVAAAAINVKENDQNPRQSPTDTPWARSWTATAAEKPEQSWAEHG